jgi:hypothetical protein
MFDRKQFLLPLVILLAAPAVLSADDKSLSGAWSGTYVYDQAGQPEVKYSMVLIEQDGEIVGLLSEPRTFAQGDDLQVHAGIKGRVDQGTRQLTIIKTYDGTAGAEHEVEYVGLVSTSGTEVKGTWSIGGTTGKFTFKKNTGTGAGPMAGIWKGTYRYDDPAVHAPVDFAMILVHEGKEIVGMIKEPKTIGEGDDPWLHASLKGTYNDKTQEFEFTKKYDGTAKVSHSVQYSGLLSDDGKTVLNGEWKLGEATGHYSLNRSHEAP